MEDIPLLSQTTAVTIQTDASNTGFGVVLIIDKRLCYAWGKLFPLTQRLHHINRKELFAIAHSACKFDDILSRMPNVKHVTMETDSKVASLQLNEFKNYNSKSIEKRVLQRLRYNVIDTWNRWRRMGLSVSHRHISRTLNSVRFFYELLGSQIINNYHHR
jgi:hypothetical protein